MSDQLIPAKLIPYDAAGENLEESSAITLDFNPETLSLQIQAGEEADRGRQGRQQTQHVAKSTATLSFDAIFDTTRPNPARGGANEVGTPEKLDVRVKTAAIAGLLQAEGEGENSSPRRVRFHWGNIIFDGLLKSLSETLDYFSAEGVPLRSKVSISITEQDFRYNVDADQVQRARATPSVDQARDIASSNGLDSLFDLSAGAGFKFDASLDLDLQVGLALEAGFDADVDFGVELGLNSDIDIGINAGVGIGLSAGAALDVFGPAALESAVGSGVDLGKSVSNKALQLVTSPTAPSDAARPPNAWAPDGPAPGSRASKLATQVQQARASSASASRERRPEETAIPLPVRGSPPLQPARFGPDPGPGLFPERQQQLPSSVDDQSGRPSWERIPPESTGTTNLPTVQQAQCCRPQRKPNGQY